MKNKKAETAVSEGMQMMYRIFLVLMVAFIILGISGTIYRNYIDVRTVEAGILNKKIFECFVQDNVIDMINLKNNENTILDFCGYSEIEIERFFVQIRITNNTGTETYQQGDSGSVWILDTIQASQKANNFEYYEPGYSSTTYNVTIKNSANSAEINIQTYINEETKR